MDPIPPERPAMKPPMVAARQVFGHQAQSPATGSELPFQCVAITQPTPTPTTPVSGWRERAVRSTKASSTTPLRRGTHCP